MNTANLPVRIDEFIASCDIPPVTTYEPWTSLFVKHSIKSNMVCVDVGANGGWYAALMSRLLNGTGKVFAIEPLVFDMLLAYRKACRDAWGEKCTLVDCQKLAFSDKEYTDKIYFSLPGWMLKPKCTCDADVEREVSFKRYDDWHKQFLGSLPVNFLKIDIDGHEVKMLRGMRKTLEQYHPTMVVEFGWPTKAIFNDDVEECRTILHAHGYKLFSCKGLSLDKGEFPIAVGSGVDVACIPPGSIFPIEVTRIYEVWQRWVATGHI